MNGELVNRLEEKYFEILQPNIYFEIKDGWYELIKNLLHVLNHHVARTPLDGKFRVFTIKEKFGGLRVYVDNGDDFIYGAIAMAECLSNNICDVCGAPGHNQAKNGWLRTRCNNHV
jgi:hypothetical protein